MDGLFRSIQDEAEAQGWRVTRTKKRHYRFCSPNGQAIVVFSGTPSDHRSTQNFLSNLRRQGFWFRRP